MLKKAKIAASIAIPALALIIPNAILAASDIVPPDLKKNIDILVILQAIVKVILLVAFVLSFIFLLIGGIKWITSGGDEKGVASARNTITAALIGLVVVLMAFALIKLVETFFGVTIISGAVCIPTASGGCN